MTEIRGKDYNSEREWRKKDYLLSKKETCGYLIKAFKTREFLIMVDIFFIISHLTGNPLLKIFQEVDWPIVYFANIFSKYIFLLFEFLIGLGNVRLNWMISEKIKGILNCILKNILNAFYNRIWSLYSYCINNAYAQGIF